MTTEHEKHREVLRDYIADDICKIKTVNQAITYLLAATEKPAIDEAVERERFNSAMRNLYPSFTSDEPWTCAYFQSERKTWLAAKRDAAARAGERV